MLKELTVSRFENNQHNLEVLASQLTELKALASRTPTPVTTGQLESILKAGDLCNLFLQFDREVVVGWCMITVSVFEDCGHLGPIAVKKEGEHTGYGTGLMESALSHMWEHHPELRRIDLSNRPSHDLEQWYSKFGFVPRTVETGDPTTVYRLARPNE